VDDEADEDTDMMTDIVGGKGADFEAFSSLSHSRTARREVEENVC
jgi:hypothetical protein